MARDKNLLSLTEEMENRRAAARREMARRMLEEMRLNSAKLRMLAHDFMDTFSGRSDCPADQFYFLKRDTRLVEERITKIKEYFPEENKPA